MATSDSNKSLSQQFLEAYIADPVKNPWGQFYQTASTGSTIGDLTQSYQKYGALVNPLELAKQARAAGSTSSQIRETGRQKYNELAALREQNYNTYKETYGKAQDLYRQMSQQGFASEEEKKRAQQGLAAVREATFLPYLANRGYLETQEKLTRAGYRRAARGEARSQLISTLVAHGMEEQSAKKSLDLLRAPKVGGVTEKEKLQMMYGAVKDVGQGGVVEKQSGLSVGENLNQMMNKPVQEAREQNWINKYWNGMSVSAQAGAQTQTSPSASLITPSKPSINLNIGGPSNMLNTKDIEAAKASGMTKKDIRETVRNEDIKMSAKAKAQLFSSKKNK